jgi:diguanylate cyclase (GGDEF)-like protein
MRATLAGIVSALLLAPSSLRTWRAGGRRLGHLLRATVVGVTTAGVIVVLTLLPVAMVIARRDTPVLPLLFLPLVAAYQSIRHSHAKERQALHDELTGLPNRRQFQQRAAGAIRSAERTTSRVAVMLLDLDRFKDINDTLGHHSGDRVLREIGRRLEALTPAKGCIARFGGDEFALMATLAPTTSDPGELASALGQALERPFVLDGFKLHIGSSTGIAIYPDHGEDIETLLQRADVAMYAAKEQRTAYEFYCTDRDRNSRRRLAIQGELRDAMANGQLTLAYQPKVDVRSGGVMGVEALIRWSHPVHGLLPPSEFVPLAEHSGLIQPLTRYIITEALLQVQQWREAGAEINVAVNVSARCLQDPELPTEIGFLLRGSGAPPSALTLELTESSIMADPPQAMRVLEGLHAMGVRLAIDDFGTGYSSLSYLRQLPVDELKIDQSFVRGAISNHNDAIIIRSTVELGRNLGLTIVAEGVEQQAHWDLLAELGCDGAQGFLVGRPLPADLVLPWYRRRTSARPDETAVDRPRGEPAGDDVQIVLEAGRADQRDLVG